MNTIPGGKMQTWHHLVFLCGWPSLVLSTELIYNVISGVPKARTLFQFIPVAQLSCLLDSELDIWVCLCSPMCLLISPCHL